MNKHTRHPINGAENLKQKNQIQHCLKIRRGGSFTRRIETMVRIYKSWNLVDNSEIGIPPKNEFGRIGEKQRKKIRRVWKVHIR